MGSQIVVPVGAGHHFLGHLVGAAADRGFEPRHQFGVFGEEGLGILAALADADRVIAEPGARFLDQPGLDAEIEDLADLGNALPVHDVAFDLLERRSEEHTSELQSLMRLSYAVFCLKKQNTDTPTHHKIPILYAKHLINTIDVPNHLVSLTVLIYKVQFCHPTHK